MKQAETPTPAQARALALFELMARLGQGQSPACATAVGRRLRVEGLVVDHGYYRQFRTRKGDIRAVEVLDLDGALVDGSGIHAHWDALARQQGKAFLEWLEGPPGKFDPEDPNWLGRRQQPELVRISSMLSAELQRQELEANTMPAFGFTDAQRRAMSLLSVLKQHGAAPGAEVCAIGLYLAGHGIKRALECRWLGKSIYAEAMSIDGALFSSLGFHEDWEAYRVALLRHHVASLAPANTQWSGAVIRIDLANEKAWVWDETARPTMDHAMSLLAAWEQERHLDHATHPAPSTGRQPRL